MTASPLAAYWCAARGWRPANTGRPRRESRRWTLTAMSRSSTAPRTSSNRAANGSARSSWRISPSLTRQSGKPPWSRAPTRAGVAAALGGRAAAGQRARSRCNGGALHRQGGQVVHPGRHRHRAGATAYRNRKAAQVKDPRTLLRRAHDRVLLTTFGRLASSFDLSRCRRPDVRSQHPTDELVGIEKV
jgi:hypothetical protein